MVILYFCRRLINGHKSSVKSVTRIQCFAEFFFFWNARMKKIGTTHNVSIAMKQSR